MRLLYFINRFEIHINTSNFDEFRLRIIINKSRDCVKENVWRDGDGDGDGKCLGVTGNVWAIAQPVDSPTRR